MCPTSSKKTQSPWANHALVYAQRLDFVNQHAHGNPTKATMGLHVLKRAEHVSGEYFGMCISYLALALTI